MTEMPFSFSKQGLHKTNEKSENQTRKTTRKPDPKKRRLEDVNPRHSLIHDQCRHYRHHIDNS